MFKVFNYFSEHEIIFKSNMFTLFILILWFIIFFSAYLTSESSHWSILYQFFNYLTVQHHYNDLKILSDNKQQTLCYILAERDMNF